MTVPTVSVIIPAYKGAQWLPATLNSLAAQTLTDWEAVVVDDESPDDTHALIEAWPDRRVRLVRMERNSGCVVARNRGVAEARGRHIAGLDQDDICHPERLARQVAYLDAHPDCAIVGTAVEVLRGARIGPSNYPATTTPALLAWLIRIENPLAWSSIMVRGQVARALTPFTRPELYCAEDFDLYGRVGAWGHVARLDEPLLLYRHHAGGMSKCFTGSMHDSATAVLAARHAAFGAGAARVAALLATHVMARAPVPDRATFAELGALLGALMESHLAAARPDAESTRLIRWETTLRWERIARAGLRAGTIRLADVMSVRPRNLGFGQAAPVDLMAGALIGGGRRVQRSIARRRAG